MSSVLFESDLDKDKGLFLSADELESSSLSLSLQFFMSLYKFYSTVASELLLK